MAKHFRVEEGATEGAPQDAATQPREIQIPRTRARARQNTTSLPYGQAASYHYSYPTAVPTEDYYTNEVEARGGIRTLGRAILQLLAWAFRIVALAFVALVMANVFSLAFMRSRLTDVTDLVTSYLPWARFGVLGVDTPFGGTFRGDFCLLALLAFIFDWLFCRARANLR